MRCFTGRYFNPACLVAVLLCATGYSVNSENVVAAELVAEPSLDTSITHNDNIQLTTADHDDVFGIIVSPKIILGYRTETSQINLNTGFDFSHFKDNETLNSDDQSYQLDTQYQTERSLWRLDAGFIRDSTRTSEQETTGLVQTANRREKLELSPTMSYALTERLSTQLSYSFQDVKYDVSGTQFLDYQNRVLSNTFSYAINERDQIDVTLYGSEYEVSDYISGVNDFGFKKETLTQSRLTETSGAQVGITHKFTETMQGTVMYGEHKTKETATAKLHTEYFIFNLEPTDEEAIPQVTRGTGKTYSASLEKQFELSTLKAELKHQLSPSGIGVLYQTDSLSLNMHKKMTDLLSFSLSMKGIRSKATGTADSSRDRKYYNLQPSLRWNLSRKWRLNASYTYVQQKYDNASEAAKSNKFMLTIGYSWSKMATSF